MTKLLAPGSLGDRFVPRRVVGAGGSGVVYEVDAKGGDGTIALKVLRAELASSEKEKSRFLLEAERMGRVRHPALVPLIDAGLLPDGRPYLAMPLLEGQTVAARIAQGPLPIDDALAVFASVASAVQALHASGLVHRDVKPENVILGSTDATRAILLDFGIARDVDGDPTTTTMEGRMRGTPAYMAPERFFGSPASVRSDVYELTVLLYVMLTGKLPWTSEEDATERLDPIDPRRVRPEISSALGSTILRALSTRPEMRPATVDALVRAIARATLEEGDGASIAVTSRQTADLDIAAVSATRPERSPTMRRRPLVPVAAGAALVVTLVGGGFAMRARSSAKPLDTNAVSHVASPMLAHATVEAPPSIAIESPAQSTSDPSSLDAGTELRSVGPAPGSPSAPVRLKAPQVAPTSPAASTSARRREEWFEDRK